VGPRTDVDDVREDKNLTHTGTRTPSSPTALLLEKHEVAYTTCNGGLYDVSRVPAAIELALRTFSFPGIVRAATGV
jgi:hypothetical protein